jgi:phage tail-like protein
VDTRSEPLIGAHFRVEIDTLPDAHAIEVIFPEARLDMERGKRVVRYGSLTLRRGLSTSSDWYDWWDRARRARSKPKEATRTVRVILIDRLRRDVSQWTFLKTAPTAYSLSPLNALAATPLIETLELSVGGFEAALGLQS